MREIALHGKHAHGRVALVDDADYALVSQYRWRVIEKRRGNSTSGPYAATTLPRNTGRSRLLYMHTLLTGWSRVDHWNGDGLDNTCRNMREATIEENNRNRHPHYRTTRSAFKGVTQSRGKWQARIMASGQRRHLGMFTSEVAAARAYDIAARELHGEFARLNFPGRTTP